MKQSTGKGNWRRNFFILWTGQAFSQLSSSVLQFAMVWYLTNQTGSALVLSAALLMGFLPQALLGPFIGVFLDRYSRKKIMILSDLGISLAGLFLVVAEKSGQLTPALLLIVLLFRAIGTAFHTPCMQAVTPQLVPKDQLTRCAGYSQTLQSVSEICSPALAAVLYQNWSLGSIILLDVLGALLAVGALLLIQIPDRAKTENIENPGFFKEAAQGIRILKNKKGILGLTLIGALFTLAMMPVSALFPLMSMSYFKGTSTQASIAEVAFSVGMLAGSLLLSAWGGTKNRIYTIIGSYLLLSLSLFGSGMLPADGFWCFAVFSFLMGLANPFYWGMYTPILQSSFTEQYLGRVLSLTGSIRLLCAPVALSLSGILAEVLGVEVWFLAAGGILLAAAVLCWCIPSVRHCDTKSDTKENAETA